jgi:hypothetical protein
MAMPPGLRVPPSNPSTDSKTAAYLFAGQATAQVLAGLLTPLAIMLLCLALWALRHRLLRRYRIFRAANSKGGRRSGARALGIAAHIATLDDQDKGEGSERVDSTPVPQAVDDEATADPAMVAIAVEAATAEPAGREPTATAVSPTKAEPAALARSTTPRSPLSKAQSAASTVLGVVRSGYASLSKADTLMSLGDQLGIVFMIAIFLFYPGWANAALSIFACHRPEGGTGPYADRQLVGWRRKGGPHMHHTLRCSRQTSRCASSQASWSHGYWLRDMTQEVCGVGAERLVGLFRVPPTHLWLPSPHLPPSTPAAVLCGHAPARVGACGCGVGGCAVLRAAACQPGAHVAHPPRPGRAGDPKPLRLPVCALQVRTAAATWHALSFASDPVIPVLVGINWVASA